MIAVRSVGFTGTRHGLTQDQLIQIHMWLGDLWTLRAQEAHHGLCLGADHEFHVQVRGFGYRIVGHPGILSNGARYLRDEKAELEVDELRPERAMLVRNEDIVLSSDVMIAAPHQKQEQFKGSGTWATMRYTKKSKKPLLIVYPDGAIDCTELWYQEFRDAIAQREAQVP